MIEYRQQKETGRDKLGIERGIRASIWTQPSKIRRIDVMCACVESVRKMSTGSFELRSRVRGMGFGIVQVGRMSHGAHSVPFRFSVFCWLPLPIHHCLDSSFSCLAHPHGKSWVQSAPPVSGTSADWATDSSRGLNDQSPILGKSWMGTAAEHRIQSDLGERRWAFRCCSSCCHCWRHRCHRNCLETRLPAAEGEQKDLEVLERRH